MHQNSALDCHSASLWWCSFTFSMLERIKTLRIANRPSSTGSLSQWTHIGIHANTVFSTSQPCSGALWVHTCTLLLHALPTGRPQVQWNNEHTHALMLTLHTLPTGRTQVNWNNEHTHSPTPTLHAVLAGSPASRPGGRRFVPHGRHAWPLWIRTHRTTA